MPRYQRLEGESGQDQVPKLYLEALGGLWDEDRARIDALAAKSVREAGARRDIIREGDKPRGAMLVLEGWGCCYKQLPDGRRQIVDFLIPGDLSDADIHLLEEMDHSIAAITPMRYAQLGAAELEALKAESPRIAEALGRHALAVASIQREWTTNVGQRCAYERIAHLICETFFRLRAVGLTRGQHCDFPLTQIDIADATGLTPVHVNRMLRELREDGLASVQLRSLVIRDLDRLTKACMFSPNYLHLDRDRRQRDAA